MATDTADRERIKTLETELAALKAKINPPKHTTAPLEEEGRVRTLFPRTFSIQMPTPSEFNELFKIVARAHPKLIPEFASDYERKQFIHGCTLGFERLASLRRLSGLDQKHATSWWVQECNNTLQRQGLPEIDGSQFFVALLMSGDINYQFANGAAGVVPTFGLSMSPNVQPASASGWKSVLQRGTPRAPMVAVTQEQHRTVVRQI